MHGEVTDPSVDFFDREAVFIERHLKPLLAAVPDLKVRMDLSSQTAIGAPSHVHDVQSQGSSLISMIPCGHDPWEIEGASLLLLLLCCELTAVGMTVHPWWGELQWPGSLWNAASA